MRQSAIEARFIDGRSGRLFVLLRRPAGQASGRCVMVAPPFAEEMNKTRALFTDLAHALSARGIAMLLPDLYGTGDSEGEFKDADWNTWKDDLCRAANWAEQGGWTVRGLLGVRLGCILAAEIASALPHAIEHTAFWQPVVEGKRFMTQFLRLRVAASMMEDRKETVEQLRSQILAGETVEVAGYDLTSTLLSQVEAAKLQGASGVGRVSWLHVARSADAGAPDDVKRALSTVTPTTVVGEPFWAATEIVRLPNLISATADAMTGTG